MKTSPVLFGRQMTPHHTEDGATVWAVGLRRGPVRITATVRESGPAEYSWRLLCNGSSVSTGEATKRRAAVSRLAKEVGYFEQAFTHLKLGRT